MGLKEKELDNNEGLARFRKLSLCYTRKRAAKICNLLEKKEGLVIDLGCGPGYLTCELKKILPEDFSILGLDIDKGMLDFAAEQAKLKNFDIDYICNPDNRLPLKDHCATMIISEYSMHHWDYPEEMFKEMYRVIRPGGVILIFDFCRESLTYWAFRGIMSLFFFKPWPFKNQFLKFLQAYYFSLVQAFPKKNLIKLLKKLNLEKYSFHNSRMTLELKITKSFSQP